LQKRKLILLLLVFLYWLSPAQNRSNAVGGNALWSTKRGEEFLDRMLQDINAAQNTIEIEYYWFATDQSGKRVKEALMAKAREGVKVRLVMDNLITPSAPESFYQEMKVAGVELYYSHPFEQMGPLRALTSILGPRDHRKIIIIDGRIAYTGGMNFYDEAIYDWIDTHVRVEGPAATQMRRLFAQTWEKMAGESLEPVSPAPVGPVVAEAFGTEGKARLDTTFIALLNQAREYFYLQTPYFVPPRELVNAFKTCAARGVDVRIIIPQKCDWGFMNELTREYAVELMRAGVGIYVYLGAYDHSKIFVTDDKLASCSTVNMDFRSLRTNWEDGFYFYDPESVGLFKAMIDDVIGQSLPLSPDSQPAEGFRRGYRKFLKILSPLF
jgi:cardiolipin synthase